MPKKTFSYSILYSLAFGSLPSTIALNILRSNPYSLLITLAGWTIIFTLFGIVAHYILAKDNVQALYPARALLFTIITTTTSGLLIVLGPTYMAPRHVQILLDNIGITLWGIGGMATAALMIFLIIKKKIWGLLLLPLLAYILITLSAPIASCQSPNKTMSLVLHIICFATFLVVCIAWYLNRRARPLPSSIEI